MIKQQRPVRLRKLAIEFGLRKGHLGPVNFQPRQIVLAAGNEVHAITGTIDGHFALRATTDGTDAFRARRTQPLRFTFIANRTGQGFLLNF